MDSGDYHQNLPSFFLLLLYLPLTYVNQPKTPASAKNYVVCEFNSSFALRIKKEQ